MNTTGSKIRLGVFGGGNMGMAIADGAAAKGIFAPAEIGVFDISDEKLASAAGKGYIPYRSPSELFSGSELVLFSVKPQNFEQLLPELRGISPMPLIVTIAAGVSTGYIRGYLGSEARVVRVMPNTPLMIGKGASALCRTENVSDGDFERVCGIFRALGAAEVLDEDKMNAVISVNGSSPAYVYYFIDAVARSGEKQGLDYKTALNLAARTFAGAAEMLMRDGRSPEELIRMVCSPGGTTIEAVKELDAADVYGTVDRACRACTRRAFEIGR